MKKLKRRISQAFKGKSSSHSKELETDAPILTQSSYLRMPNVGLSLPTNAYGFGSQFRTCSLSDSMNQLAERLAADGVIFEEGNGDYTKHYPTYYPDQYRDHSSTARRYKKGSENGLMFRPCSTTALNHTGVVHYPDVDQGPQFVMRPKKYEYKRNNKGRINSWHATRFFNNSSAVVHEASALGSDGESLEVSPCTSDQMSTSSCYPSSANGIEEPRYIPNVKMRQKPTRKWSEQDIQKRLSLPADIKLPQNVVDKLNRTPTLENPLTRKSRRASLNEIGFGKLETYKKIFDLGEGTYATVYLGKSLLTGKSVALKEIRLEHEEGAPCTAIREVSLLRSLKHVNVVTLHDIVYTDRMLTLVFEFIEHDLRDYMEELENMISMSNVKLFLIQLLRGLAYCHKKRVLHRDLKPQNLLINRQGELKLADFGLARAQSVPTKTYSNEVVTLWYRPPDVLLGSTDYSTHIDMWGVGCIFYEMLAHKPMFPGSTTDEQLNLIFQTLGTPTKERHQTLCEFPLFKASKLKNYKPKSIIRLAPRIDLQSADLLEKLLQYDGRQRITAADAMRHRFFNCFPEAIFSLPDTETVLSLPGVHYEHEAVASKTLQ